VIPTDRPQQAQAQSQPQPAKSAFPDPAPATPPAQQSLAGAQPTVPTSSFDNRWATIR
jgi:hypothetical protein